MKKILFATTALVATAGVASAEVALKGSAEMGIYGGNQADTQFFTDLDVTFVMTGEADNGLTFGATIDLDEAADKSNPGRFESPNVTGGENMFITYGGMTLTMGDTDGALDKVVPEMALAGGSLNDDETAHAGFQHMDGADSDSYALIVAVNELNLGMVAGLSAAEIAALRQAADDAAADLGAVDLNDYTGDFGSADEVEAFLAIAVAGRGLDGFGDGQIARFDYAYDAFGFSLSAEQTADGADAANVGDTIWSIGGSWNGQVSTIDMSVGLGYQDLDDVASVWALGVTGALPSGFTAGFDYSKTDIEDMDDVTHWGVGFGYEMNALAIGVNWGQFEYDGEEQSGAGLAVAYDLGGGLSAQFGYGHSDLIAGDDLNTYSLGLAMSF